jgi:hypothetical protein
MYFKEKVHEFRTLEKEINCKKCPTFPFKYSGNRVFLISAVN